MARPTANRKLDLNLLSVAVALLDAGSVSKAAISLGISQPTVSTALSKLRHYFGDPLFVRCPNGMAPTPRGAEIAAAARGILQEVDMRLKAESTFDPQLPHRPFTFALSDVGEIVFLPILLRELALAAPNTPIQSVSMRPDLLVQAMNAGNVDLAIGYFPDLHGKAFLQQRLLNHHFVCLLRHSHPIQGNRLTLGEFLSLQHAVVRSEGRSQEILEAYLESERLSRRVALYTPHFLSIPRLISRSDMIVTVPHAVALAYGRPEFGLKSIQLPFESPRISLMQHWHRKVNKDARNQWLRKLVSNLFNDSKDEWSDASGAALRDRGQQRPS